MTTLQVLLELQAQHGYLPEAELARVCDERRVPRAEVESLLSFYPHLRRQPPSPHRVAACRDLTCHMGDGETSRSRLSALCDARDDTDFEPVSCLGRCDTAPACTLDGVPMTIDEACRRLESGDFESSQRTEASADKRRWQIDPYPTSADHYSQLRGVLTSGDRRKAIEQLSASGLRGMGGAGFPTGRKWALVAEQPDSPRYVICNADESEPGTFKDREILRNLAHLVIEGMVLAGHAIDSAKGWIYIRHEYEPELSCLRRALDAARDAGALGENIFGSGFDFEIEIFVSPGGYVLGEETALLEVLEGRRGEPRNKPPYPGTAGLHGKPTLMNNVESFAHVPRIVRTGRLDHKFFAISGDVNTPGVYELPVGATFRELLERAGGVVDGGDLLAFLPGGASTGFLSAEQIDVPMTFDALNEAGSSLGSGAVIVLRKGRDLLDAAANLTAFFRNESCGKCVPCRVGCEHAVKAIEEGNPEALAQLGPLRDLMVDTSICGLAQAALTPVMSVIEGFTETERGSGRSSARNHGGDGNDGNHTG